MSSFEDTRRKLVARYVSTFPDKLAELARVRDVGDHDELRNLAHRLAGSGASYGFPEISERATEVELASDDAILEAADGLIAAIERAGQAG